MTMDEVIQIAKEAKRADEATVWIESVAQNPPPRDKEVVSVRASTSWGGATRGAKEMDYYLQVAAENMSNVILSNAQALARRDRDAGRRMMEALAKGYTDAERSR